MDGEAGHNRDRGRAVDEKDMLRKGMIVLSLVMICVGFVSFTNLPVELLTGLRVYANYSCFNMGIVLLILGVFQPCTNFSTATLYILIGLGVVLIFLAAGLTVKFPVAA